MSGLNKYSMSRVVSAGAGVLVRVLRISLLMPVIDSWAAKAAIRQVMKSFEIGSSSFSSFKLAASDSLQKTIKSFGVFFGTDCSPSRVCEGVSGKRKAVISTSIVRSMGYRNKFRVCQ